MPMYICGCIGDVIAYSMRVCFCFLKGVWSIACEMWSNGRKIDIGSEYGENSDGLGMYVSGSRCDVIELCMFFSAGSRNFVFMWCLLVLVSVWCMLFVCLYMALRVDLDCLSDNTSHCSATCKRYQEIALSAFFFVYGSGIGNLNFCISCLVLASGSLLLFLVFSGFQFFMIS